MKHILIKIIGKVVPVDVFAKSYPVSVKGIVMVDGKIPLLKNDREEWELPGGKLDPNESPEECAVREIQEEINLNTHIGKIIDTWVYDIRGKVKVLIITYGCNLISGQSSKDLRISNEHKEMKLFLPEEIPGLNMPQGYKDSISKWLDMN